MPEKSSAQSEASEALQSKDLVSSLFDTQSKELEISLSESEGQHVINVQMGDEWFGLEYTQKEWDLLNKGAANQGTTLEDFISEVIRDHVNRLMKLWEIPPTSLTRGMLRLFNSQAMNRLKETNDNS